MGMGTKAKRDRSDKRKMIAKKNAIHWYHKG